MSKAVRSYARTFLPLKLAPWRLSGMLTPTRTTGELGFHWNGSAIDIWIRIDGKVQWFAVSGKTLMQCLQQGADFFVLPADSDHNAENADGQV